MVRNKVVSPQNQNGLSLTSYLSNFVFYYSKSLNRDQAELLLQFTLITKKVFTFKYIPKKALHVKHNSCFREKRLAIWNTFLA